jgi:hypothetical protein
MHTSNRARQQRKLNQRRPNKRVLFLAPQPFYQDRGTPIAVDLLLRVYSERGEILDVLTYHEGRDVSYQHINIIRTPKVPFICNIRPGFSWKKLVCDAFMFMQAAFLVSTRKYQFIHAVEESVFIALLFKLILGIPYLYDMDSSLSQQMVEKYPRLAFISDFLAFCEGIAIKNAEVVIPVCDRLAQDIQQYRPQKVVILPDVSLVS